ncbi:MAG: sigma-54 dependent transcriptional regulator [Bacteroidota bacterium]|nr:sigma-54 dependent transcriptional regulator [Bacteroidota bacterium]MDP4233416.1 sigma-54 dependent transcriptional regulator [Bacteroidota bacterium]MDP4242282.1 sigma-54 dependent transcriptional regulator [Bacteroidota bacterium]MDP4287038.1 sigma-54 dependent transcriptional regulator [Bacteroidota bacterium]
MAHILIIDDEAGIRDTLAMIFEYEHHQVSTAESGIEGLKFAQNSDTPIDCILLDVKMPGMDGIECLEKLKEIRPDVPVIMISGHGNIETAVEATKLGAFDFLEKPPDRQRLLLLVRNATEKKQLVSENRVMRERLKGKERMLGTSQAMRNIRAIIERVAPTDARVLVTGENGTGKELVARAIHRASKRVDKPFVEVNCAAIPKDLIESELFGHEKGSFTGAAAQRIGKFEQADLGTLFLDEIGDMSMDAQAKMLRVIEEGRLERVGSSSSRPIPVNVRILAATNKNLPEEIRQGRFREDLYHRLNVIPIHVPPLRERREDIPLLVRAFGEEFTGEMPRKSVRFDEGAMRLLTQLPFSGNIRELRNIVERIVILVPGDIVRVEDVERLGLAFSMSEYSADGRESESQRVDAPSNELEKSVILTPIDRRRIESVERDYALMDEDHPLDGAMQAPTFQEFKDRAEKVFIEEKLREHNYNISRTAEALDIQRSHLYTKMRKFGLTKDSKGIETVAPDLKDVSDVDLEDDDML